MALDTYSGLKSAVADWLARTDLTSQIPDFIAMAEARLNRELRTREMVTQATGTVSTQVLAIPADFIEVVRLTLDTDTDMPLEYRPVEDAESRVAGVTSGEPKWFSVLGSEFRFYPAPDGTYSYTLDYYRTLPALSDTNTTNWLLAKAPDVYLYGALCESAPFLQEDGRIQVWETRFQQTRRSLHAAESRAKRTSGPLRARILV